MNKLPANSPKQALQVAFKDDMENIAPFLQALLPYEGAVQKFKQMTLLAIHRNFNLLQCNRKSLLLSLLWCAQKDLEPGVDDGCWLIPYKDSVTPVPAYKGIIKKAVATETVLDVQPEAVYDKDDFEYELGLSPFLKHRPPKLGVDRGKLIGAYVVFVMPDGTKRFNVMDRPSIEKIRSSSASWRANSKSGPWVEWEEAMFLKTVIKQGFKYIPVKPALRDLLNEDNILEIGTPVGALIQQGSQELPQGMDEFMNEPEPEAPTKALAADTSAFDTFVDEKLEGATPDHLKHWDHYFAAGVKHKGGEDAFKIYCQKNLDAIWTAFEAWEAKNFPPAAEQNQEQDGPEQSEPEQEAAEEAAMGNGVATEGTVVTLDEQREAVWRTTITKGIPLPELQSQGINGQTDITAENIDAIKAFVDGWAPPKKGKKNG